MHSSHFTVYLLRWLSLTALKDPLGRTSGDLLNNAYNFGGEHNHSFQDLSPLQLLSGCSSNSKAVWNRVGDMNNYAPFLPANQKRKQDLAEAHSSREVEEEKGIGPISNSCVVFSAPSNWLPSNRATTPLENMCRGSHSASYPTSLAPVSHPLPSNYCSFHLTSETPKDSLSSFIAPFPN